MVIAGWIAVVVVAVIGLAPALRRLVLAAVGFVCLSAAFLIYGNAIRDQFPTVGEMRLLVVALALAAALGYLFGAAGADRILRTDRRALGAWGKVALVLIAVVLGGLFFAGASYLSIQCINPAYVKFLDVDLF